MRQFLFQTPVRQLVYQYETGHPHSIEVTDKGEPIDTRVNRDVFPIKLSETRK